MYNREQGRAHWSCGLCKRKARVKVTCQHSAFTVVLEGQGTPALPEEKEKIQNYRCGR